MKQWRYYLLFSTIILTWACLGLSMAWLRPMWTQFKRLKGIA